MTRKSGKQINAKAGSLKSGEPVFLLVGKLLRTHGLHGEYVLHLETDFPERIKPRKMLYCGDAHDQLTVSKLRSHDKYFIIGFKGIESVDDARRYINQFLYVKTDEIESLPEGHFYFHDLIGMDVFEKEIKIGTVSEMLETGANDVMVVLSAEGKEILLPVIESVILSIDSKTRRVDVLLPEWL
jgi:16S rRNA processing protein RimM